MKTALALLAATFVTAAFAQDEGPSGERKVITPEMRKARLKEEEAKKKAFEAEEKKRLAAEAEAQKAAEAEAKKLAVQAAAATNGGTVAAVVRADGGVVVPGASPAAAAPVMGPKNTKSLIPARNVDEAKTDPRFVPGAVAEKLELKVRSVTDRFPFFAIPENGCGSTLSYVLGDLTAPYDGQAAGVPVVLRLEESSTAAAGSTLAVQGFRRAGKARDGSFVYCGKSSAK